MKKLLFPVTLFVLAAMVLAACGTAVTPSSGTAAVPNTASSATPATETGMGTSTSAAPTSGAVTSIAQATASGTGTSEAPTSGAVTGTPSAQATSSSGSTQATGTPAAQATGTGTTGGTGGSASATDFIRLSALMNATVNTSDKAQAGKVDGVIVERPVLPEEASADTTATPAATPTTAPTATPVVIRVRYVVVNTGSAAGGASSSSTSGGREVLVPWQSVSFAAGSGQSAGTVNLNAGPDVLKNAPHFTLIDISTSSATWNSKVSQYWSGQGATDLPSGSDVEKPGAMVLVTRTMRGLNVADDGGAVLGSVADLLVRAQTGELAYVVFNGGQAFNNQNLVVPLNFLTWSNGTGTTPGSFNLNVKPDQLKNAPGFSDLQQIPLDPSLTQQLNNFWSTLQNNQGGTSK